jgi:glycosyltransferase involved in cell wall biosynthesis
VSATRPLRVHLPCTGLGRERRGFEAFTRECAAALRSRTDLTLRVLGGGGTLQADERRVRSLARSSRAARLIAALAWRSPYYVEQASFFASYLRFLVADSPDVVYFGDVNLGNACWHWRRLSGARYRLLYYNGGATTLPFTRCDLVQQVSPEHLDAALARGEPPDRQVLLPHGLAIPREFRIPNAGERRRIRESLGVPVEGQLLLGVGALGSSEKRWDVVVRAVAALPPPRPHLLLLGAPTAETSAVLAIGHEALGPTGFTMRSVERPVALDAYRAADAFVLASLREGLGIAHIEALAAGLPCVAHDAPTTRYIFGTLGFLGNVMGVHVLTALLARALAAAGDEGAAWERHARAWERFSWERLAPRYAELLRACAERRAPRLEQSG